MNIVFIYSLDDVLSKEKPLRTPEQIQIGISYISSFLKNYDHRTQLLVLSKIFGKKNKDVIDKCLQQFHPKLICFTAVASEYEFIASIAKYIKNKYKEIFLLIGGSHASLNPEDVIMDSFDALCIGEGERPTLEFVTQLEKEQYPRGISNLWIKKGSKIERNLTQPFLQDIDDLPFPDREMWKEWIDEQPGSRHTILLGRGCPFDCSYCCNHSLRKLATGKYVRFRSPDNIMKEVKEISVEYPKNREIWLEVETIGINIDWIIDLCLKLEDFNKQLDKPLLLCTNLRITKNIDLEKLFIAFKKSNFKMINIGLESGSERIRREVLRRNYSNEDIINAVSLARKYNLKICFFNLIGIPGETLQDFEETVKINRICIPDQHFTSIFFPYPGTDLYKICQEEGLINNKVDNTMERSKAVLDIPTFRRKDIQKKYIWFDYLVYKGHKPLYKILTRVFLAKINTNIYTKYFFRKLMHFILFRYLKSAIKNY